MSCLKLAALWLGLVLASRASASSTSFNVKTFPTPYIATYWDAFISNGALCLTSDFDTHRVYSKSASAFYTRPIAVLSDVNGECRPMSFATSFSFSIESSSGFADGFTFSLIAGNGDLTKVNGDQSSMGYKYSGDLVGSLAIEFDTWFNIGVCASSQEPDNSHIGIDTDFVTLCSSLKVVSTRSFNLDLHSSSTKYAWIEYSKDTGLLEVYLATDSSKPSFPILADFVDLCGLMRPSSCATCQKVTTAYIGFTGGTGGHSETTTIYGPWVFNTDSSNWQIEYFADPQVYTHWGALIDEGILQLSSTYAAGHPDAGSTYAFYSTPIKLLYTTGHSCVVSSFTASFAFEILLLDVPGDGFAFVLTTSNADLTQISHKGGGLGYGYTGDPSTVGSLAIEFDTFLNSCSDSSLEPDESHVAIDANFEMPCSSLACKSTLNSVLDLRNGLRKYVWITYTSHTSELKVFLSTSPKKPWTPTLKYTENLCDKLRPTLCTTCQSVETVFVGFTSGTGGYSDDVKIIGPWVFESAFPSPPSPPQPPPPPLPIKSTGLLPPSGIVEAHLGLNFRYGSTGFVNSDQGGPIWEVAQRWNWVKAGAVTAIKDEKSCGACWAFSVAAAMESAYYITSAWKAPPPSISVQQFVDCQGSGNCTGGWPGDALEYASTNFLTSSSKYAYKSSHGRCQTNLEGVYKIKGFEKVNFFGWFGLLIAIQQQPVLVNLEASQRNFVIYESGIFNDPNCFVNGVDHTVVIVGYDLTTNPQYWWIKNSWGRSWGESGYMRIAMLGGAGMCGMNTMPGFYPVFKGNDACFTKSYGLAKLKNTAGTPGTLNPCGGGTCTLSGSVNKCKCFSGFQVATNAGDGSQTCVPDSVCTFFSYNPCGVGICLDVKKKPGTYTCICPLGFVLGTRTLDKSQTCILYTTSPTSTTYTVPSGVTVTCSALANFYGVLYTSFVKNQKAGVCVGNLKAGTKVNVRGARKCRLPYITVKGDTCASVAKLFGVSPRATFGVGSLNPNIRCTSPFVSGTNICILSGSITDASLCVTSYTSQPGDTCSSIIKSRLFNKNATKFYSFNLGINCANLVQTGTSEKGANRGLVGQEVCLDGTSFGTIKKGCTHHQVYAWKKGDHCGGILRQYYSNSQRIFRKLNQMILCLDKTFHEGATICRP
eukprot:TRINITY_DN3972_c0_g2_i1.p1 TRINITY_DN3972_c0_g2~~TRINITY_DN3972_c0_g2_i1.p1  ORF type:complete len:1158 (+),score=61.25 TRINITY_DN3972_c0_g2_i1:580-4053(+)